MTRGSRLKTSDDAFGIRGVSKDFHTRGGTSVRALDDVTISAEVGRFASIVGPSGCGKSTLLRILGGLASATRGDVEIAGEPVTGPRRDVAFVFQRPLLLDWMTVRDNVLLPARIARSRKPDAATRERAHALLELVGIGDFGDKLPRQLSGGMQQRAAIARALFSDPSLLLLDEPFGSLDALTREQLHVELLRIWTESAARSETHDDRATTILMVTHDIAEAVFLSDVVYVMSHRPGRILARIDIDLPRPRDLDISVVPEFGATVARVRSALSAEESRNGNAAALSPEVEA